MGLFMYVTEQDRVLKRKVSDKIINEVFQEAVKFCPSLMIEEHKRFKKKFWKNEFKETKIWWNVYHEAPAFDGSAYQAEFQFSGSGSREIVVAYLHGIINGVINQKK